MADRIVVLHDGRVAGELPAGASEEEIMTMATGTPRVSGLASRVPPPRHAPRSSTWRCSAIAGRLGGPGRRARGGNLLSQANTVDMLTRSSLLGFVAIGQTLVILCRSLDLSVGYVMALSSLVAPRRWTATRQDRRSVRSPRSASPP